MLCCGQDHVILGYWHIEALQNGCHFAGDNFKCISLNENVWILIKNSLEFVPKSPLNNIPVSFHIMTWHWPDDKPLSELMIVQITDAYMHHSASMTQQYKICYDAWAQVDHVRNDKYGCQNYVVNDGNGRVNSLRLTQSGRRFAYDIFKCIFLNENVWISTKISLMFVPKGPINNIPALIQIMAWRRPGDKPLSETMMVSLPTHICVTRPQWVTWKSERNKRSSGHSL